jgi:hypothetical protein
VSWFEEITVVDNMATETNLLGCSERPGVVRMIQHNGLSSIMSEFMPGSQAFRSVTPSAQTHSLTSYSTHSEDVQTARLIVNAQHGDVNAKITPLGFDSRPSPLTPIDQEHYQNARNHIRTWEGASTITEPS